MSNNLAHNIIKTVLKFKYNFAHYNIIIKMCTIPFSIHLQFLIEDEIILLICECPQIATNIKKKEKISSCFKMHFQIYHFIFAYIFLSCLIFIQGVFK